MRVRRVGYVLAAAAVVAATVVACRHLDIRPLASASPGWVLAALAINAAAMFLRALAWLGMLRAAMPGERIPPGRVIRATMIGVFGSALVPGRVGEPLRMWLIARRIDRGGALATVTGTVLSQTLLNLAALLLLGALALPERLAGHGTPATIVAFAWPAVLAVAFLVAAQLAPRGLLARQLTALKRGLVVFRRPRRGAAITALQFGAWGLQTLAAYVLLRALSISVAAPLATAAAILVAVNITAAVPVTPSNIGVFQAACIGVLAGVGVAAGTGLSYGLLLQGTEIVTALALGLPAAGRELWNMRAPDSAEHGV